MHTTDELKVIAQTIIAQLGGAKFKAMTGAKDFVFGRTGEEKNPYLQFHLPANFAKNNITIVIVTLNSSDTYDVQYMKSTREKNGYGGFSPKAVLFSQSENIYEDMLQDDFTEATGLDTKL